MDGALVGAGSPWPSPMWRDLAIFGYKQYMKIKILNILQLLACLNQCIKNLGFALLFFLIRILGIEKSQKPLHFSILNFDFHFVRNVSTKKICCLEGTKCLTYILDHLISLPSLVQV